ncbi:MAG: MFS transporter [Hyphomicrobiaceae bacterium]
MKTEPTSSLGFVGPLAGTFAVQTIVSMAMFGVAVIAPVAAPAIGVQAELIGTFSAIAYGVGMLAGLMTGALANRFGAIRVCQLSMVLAFFGVIALTVSTPLAAIASAVILGLSYGPVNPASTEILARVTTPRTRPLIFSAKQTGMPAGAALAGAILPLLIATYDWRIAIAFTGGLAIVIAMAIQPLQGQFSATGDDPRQISLGSIIDPLKLVWWDARLRCLICVGLVYGGSQVAIATFFVIHLTSTLAMPLEIAGLMYTALQLSAVAGRLIWGGIAGQLVPGNYVLVGLGFATPISAITAGLFDPSWPLWSIVLASILLGITSHGFNGVLFSELTRHVSPEKTGAAAGGLQFAMLAGVATVPLVFGLLVTLCESYLVAYTTTALAVLSTAIYALVTLRA